MEVALAKYSFKPRKIFKPPTNRVGVQRPGEGACPCRVCAPWVGAREKRCVPYCSDCAIKLEYSCMQGLYVPVPQLYARYTEREQSWVQLYVMRPH